MENSVRDVLQREEHLKSTLYCDDKEKLRRKLAVLQREYLRTAQRLQRAERLDAVRRHVRSRITQHNHQDQRDPELTSKPCLNPSLLTLNTTSETAQDGRNEGPADSDSSKRSQVIRFLLPSDATCPQTPDLIHDVARGHRPSPAMRLRSRRSRLRWERRSTESTEAGRLTDKSEEAQEQSEKSEAIRIDGEKEEIKSEETEVVNENEEQFSASESSESPSLLLTHWNTYQSTETGDMEGKEVQEPRENESTPLPLKGCKIDTNIEEGGPESTQKGRMKERQPGKEEQNESEKIEHKKRHVNTLDTKEEKSGTEQDGKSVGLLDSCTLVEGLLFPVEYYVRTTRRMTFSQSQPDMQAIILTQLSTGRYRRSRGRSRRSTLNRNTQTNEHTQTDFFSLATTSVEPLKLSHVRAPGFSADLTGNSQSSSENLDQISDSQNTIKHFSSIVDCSYRPGRGRRRKRGRGRGRFYMPRSSLGLHTNNLGLGQMSDSAQPTNTSVSPSLSHYLADEPAPSLNSQEAVPVTNDDLPGSSHTTPTQISSGINEAQSRTMTAQLDMVYPIFLNSSVGNNSHTEMDTSTSTSQSVVLPSSPSAQTCFHSVPFQSLGSLISSLMTFDIQQDFHLPDDQFASLKLHKLRQVTAESAVESFTSPYNTRNSKRLSNSSCTASSDPLMPFPLPLSLTPTITKSPRFTGDKQATAQSVDLENLSVDHKLANQSSSEVSSDTPDTPGEQQTENLHTMTLTTSQESVSLVDHLAADCVNRCKEHETVILNSCKKSILTSNRDSPTGKVNVTEHSNELKVKQSASERQKDCIGVVHSLEEQRSKNHQTEQNTITKTPRESPEEVSYNCIAGETCNKTETLGDSAVKEDLKGPSNCTTSPVGDKSVEPKRLEHHSIRSQLLLSPLASAAYPFMSSSAHPSSPTLPSLGLTPHLACPQTSSPSAPTLTLPPPHIQSIQALSPPALSPCLSCTSLPSSLPPASPSSQNPSSLDGCHRVDLLPCSTLSRVESQGSGGLMNQGIEGTENECKLRPTHTLKAPAGSCLVDACCLPAHSGGLCVAAAGKWAVCLWSQISASDWNLIHTWTFNEQPVINVFPLPDAADLMCATLGQLEIREVRMLSCSFLTQVLLYEGIVQAVVGVSKSRVVISSHSATGSSLQVFNLSDSISTPAFHHLVSPGVCIGALAPVDGLPDALIGTDECGHLYIWNLNTRQLLQRVTFGDDLSHTACLRGYSYCGVLFVLLQHQLLSSLEEEEKRAKAKDQMFSDEEEEAEKKKTAVFSLVAVNPLSGKSVLATKLYPPKAWSGRLCEADVNCFSVVGLSQSGCVCVWKLIHQGDPRMVWAPEGEGWQLARWGGGDVLLTGHHNGDVTLHCYSHNSQI